MRGGVPGSFCTSEEETNWNKRSFWRACASHRAACRNKDLGRRRCDRHAPWLSGPECAGADCARTATILPSCVCVSRAALNRANKYIGQSSLDGLTLVSMQTQLTQDLVGLQTRGYCTRPNVKISSASGQ
jgi:hypothetical protein